MVPQNWIIDCLKMFKINGEVYTMPNWRVELTAIGKSLSEGKTQRRIFLGDAVSPLLFVIVMMPLNHMLRKCTGWHILHKSQEKINRLMYTDDTKLLAENEKELETVIQTMRIYSQDIGMEKCVKIIMKSRKRHRTEGIELPNQEKSESLEKRKPTNTWEYWKRMPLDMQRWKKK